MKRKVFPFLILLISAFVLQAQAEFIRHDGFYTFNDLSKGKSINLFVDDAGKVFWVDGPENIKPGSAWFQNQNVNTTSAVITKNKMQITVKQPNNVVIKGKGKIWYGEIKFKLKYYKGSKKVNTQWMVMRFIPFKN